VKIASTQQKKTLTFPKPIIRRQAIGKKPVHSFDQNPEPEEAYVATKDPFQTGNHTVWASLPDKNPDGTPVMRNVQETVDLAPRSPWKYGGIAGGLGAAIGAGAGALLSSAVGTTPGIGAAIGGVAVGGVAGAIGAYSVYGEKTKLVWDNHDIQDHKMLGYRELVGPGKKGETTGHFHRYMADVETTKIGSFKTPRVVRYKGDNAPEDVKAPGKETAQKDIPKEPGKNLDVTVSWEKEKLQSRHLGSIPRDYHSYSGWGGGYTSCDSGGCHAGGRGIYRNTPVYEPDSEPRVDAVTQRIQAAPYSVPLFAAGGAAAGGAVGAGLGLLVSHLTGLPASITAGVGAGVAGIAAGIGAGKYAAGDHVRLEWRENGIHEKRLAGYREYVSAHYETRCWTETDSDGNQTQECETYQDGYDHSFSPDVRYWEVGSYIGPKVVHFQKKDGQLLPKEEEQQQSEDKQQAPNVNAA
jgi:hypothetical protein